MPPALKSVACPETREKRIDYHVETQRNVDTIGPQSRHGFKLRTASNEKIMNASDDNQWDTGMERMPLLTFEDDRLTIENFRNFRYDCNGRFDPKYETRTLDMRSVETVDYIVVPFQGQADLAHTMVSFGCASGEHFAVSVEARRRKGQAYGLLKGMFGAFPLMYVISDERDVIGLRTECRGDEVYLYRSKASAEQVNQFFRCMMRRADKLSKSPERYNTVFNNCLTNLRYHVNRIWPGLVPVNWRLLFNAHSDYLAYKVGLLEEGESFESTRKQALINERAEGHLNDPNFSQIIRS